MAKKIWAVAVASVLLAGCATTTPKQEQIGSVEALYNSGQDQLEAKKYRSAITTFEELQRQHPYSNWATKSEMSVIYAHYKMREYDELVLAANRFIRMHPGHQDLAYVYYIKGISYYEQISDVKRDQGFTEDALRAFEELVRRFPDSDYARDAKLKITLCHDHLAGKEMMVGRYYQKRERYLAAINRFRSVVEKYQTSTHAPEALYRLVESYLAIGIHDEAQMAGSVLGHNFPASDWYKDAYDLLKNQNLEPETHEASWLAKVYQGVKDAF